MNITEINHRSWILSEVPAKTLQKDVYEFMKSLNCACHVEEHHLVATKPFTYTLTIVEDF